MPIVALLCKRNYGTALSAARLVGSGFKPTSHGAEQLPSLVLGASGPRPRLFGSGFTQTYSCNHSNLLSCWYSFSACPKLNVC